MAGQEGWFLADGGQQAGSCAGTDYAERTGACVASLVILRRFRFARAATRRVGSIQRSDGEMLAHENVSVASKLLFQCQCIACMQLIRFASFDRVKIAFIATGELLRTR